MRRCRLAALGGLRAVRNRASKIEFSSLAPFSQVAFLITLAYCFNFCLPFE
jgi:hypothetical protein